MQQGLTTPTQPFKPDYIYWIKHYVGLFWRWKWYIIPTLPVLVVTWMLLVLTFGKIRPELSVSVLMGVEKQSSALALGDMVSTNLGKMRLIQSRNFLGEIVDSLSLNFILPKFNRSSIFTFLSIDSSAIPGQYQFDIDEKSKLHYLVTVTNKNLGINKKVITTGRLPSLDTLQTTGITLAFSPRYLKKPYKFDFYVIPKEKAIETVRGRISIKGNTRRDPMMEGVVLVNYSGTDPVLISTTINTIANKFVEKNLSFRKRKTSEILKALQTQLQAASAQLLQDENRVRAFKEENPKVGLGIDAQNAISAMTMLETKDMTITNESSEASDILQRLQSGNDNDQTSSEALLFLSSRKIPSAIILQQEFANHLQQKASLIASRYSPDHPLVKEVQIKIDAIKAKTVPIMTDYIKKQENEIAQTRAQKNQSMIQLKGLPQKEMQLAALTRQQQINSEIYSNILTKYNQAKIADETEVADIYIMDYSVPPEEASAKKELMKLLAIGLAVCLLISFGPAVATDLLDKKARSEDDLRRFVPYLFLESIPVLVPKKENKQKANDPYIRKIDPKLIEIGPNVTHIHETFRSLRAKINHRLEIVQGKSFMVTGYDSGDGKSLIASNIAIIAAQQHIPTLLIDGDMRRGILHETFAVDNQPGLSDLLLSDVQITEQMIRSTIKPTSFSHLFLLTCGTPIENSTELLTRPRFKGIMQWIYARFAMVIIDTPPLSPVTDPIILSSMVSGTLLVIRAGKTNTAGLNSVINEYPSFKEKILGVVLNGVNNNARRKKYDTYYYHNQERRAEQQLLLTSQHKDEVA
ncbi:MAG: polysaccharide biosynthesis tyrosine autokinase [Fibrobacter sp.]|nr:polysaccharide biosynthesis tyrosine autokinase [Fibrobacter sp.]